MPRGERSGNRIAADLSAIAAFQTLRLAAGAPLLRGSYSVTRRRIWITVTPLRWDRGRKQHLV